MTWEGYTLLEKEDAINKIMLRDKIEKTLLGIENPLSWADEIGAHPLIVNRLVTVQEILKELFEETSILVTSFVKTKEDVQ